MTILNSTFQQNTVTGSDGGGIDNAAGGTLTIQYSTIDDNTVSSNSCDDCASGGGISSSGTLTLEFSTVSNNHADNGGGLINRGTATIRRSTFTGNQAGAIKNSDGTMSIVFSTISGNLASPYPDSGVGGIENYDTLSLTNVTIANNTNAQFQYGGLFTNTTASSDYKATIFANNGPKNCSTAGSQTSVGFNVYAPATAACTTVGTDLAVADAKLGPLQDNGGPTLTMMPASDGPAVDHAGGCPGLDQRNAPHSGSCDSGATEYGTQAPTVSPSPSPSTPPIAYPMGDNSCSDSIEAADLTGELKLAVELQAPDTCGRETIPCFPFNGSCNPIWDDTNCDVRITPVDALVIAAKLAGVPMTISDCPVVGEAILHP
jgi:predicted outer membrane repeat protein